MFDLS